MGLTPQQRVANYTRANAEATHKARGLWPMYFWLIEDGERKTVITVPDSASLKEINTWQKAARRDGVIIELHKATLQDWLDTHNG